MKPLALLLQLGALCVAASLFPVATPSLRAQATTETPPKTATTADALSQAELLKAYLQVREQLHAAELAIVNNRAEADADARAQAAAIGEKLEAIRSSMEAERQRQQAETARLAAERERQQAESERSARAILWAGATFGAIGVLAMLAMPFFQWRAINRMVEVSALRPQLGLPAHPPLLSAEPAAPSDQAVAASNQRLLSVIDRMERRIFELEHTASAPSPAPANGQRTDGEEVRRAAAAEQAVKIESLLAKGQVLLKADRAKEAVACYNEILKIDLNHPEALVRRGAALERLQQDEEAIQCYDRAIKADRSMTLAYLYKGGVCNRLERYEEALKCYELALQAEERDR